MVKKKAVSPQRRENLVVREKKLLFAASIRQVLSSHAVRIPPEAPAESRVMLFLRAGIMAGWERTTSDVGGRERRQRVARKMPVSAGEDALRGW